ncbi:MAG: hypothetical protein ACRDQW_03020 [Haloechinothrix sp.]
MRTLVRAGAEVDARFGQRSAAEYLRARGSDINWIGWDDLTPRRIAPEWCWRPGDVAGRRRRGVYRWCASGRLLSAQRRGIGVATADHEGDVAAWGPSRAGG